MLHKGYIGILFYFCNFSVCLKLGEKISTVGIGDSLGNNRDKLCHYGTYGNAGERQTLVGMIRLLKRK